MQSKEIVMEAIGKRIAKARDEEADLSQEELASRIGDAGSASSILRWENEKALVPIHALLRIASVLEKPLSFFLQDVAEDQRRVQKVGGYIGVRENGDRAELGVRLRDLVEEAESCEVYINLS